MSKQAVIFDMDGVITDSEPLYAQAVNLVLTEHGLALTEEDHRAIMGSSIDSTWRYVIDRLGLDGDMARWKAQYDRAVLDLLRRHVTPAPGLYRLLARLEKRGVKIGLATSSQQNWADAVLDRLNLAGRFQAVAACEMVREAKPAPDLYLLAASRLGVPPGACLAIEDTPRGIQSARTAGMTTVAVRTQATAHMDVSAADRVIDSLEEFDMRWLDEPLERRQEVTPR